MIRINLYTSECPYIPIQCIKMLCRLWRKRILYIAQQIQTPCSTASRVIVQYIIFAKSKDNFASTKLKRMSKYLTFLGFSHRRKRKWILPSQCILHLYIYAELELYCRRNKAVFYCNLPKASNPQSKIMHHSS